MRSKRLVWMSVFVITALAVSSHAGAQEFVCGEEALHFGTVAGEIAIEPDAAFVACAVSGVLVFHPENVEEAAERLEAVVLPSGEWETNLGTLVAQPASLVIDRGGEPDATLPLIAADQVVLATTAGHGVCGTLLKGWACKDFTCHGCKGTTLWNAGPKKFSKCNETKVATDRCFLDGGQATCRFIKYTGPGCAGTKIESGSRTFETCQ